MSLFIINNVKYNYVINGADHCHMYLINDFFLYGNEHRLFKCNKKPKYYRIYSYH